MSLVCLSVSSLLRRVGRTRHNPWIAKRLLSLSSANAKITPTTRTITPSTPWTNQIDRHVTAVKFRNMKEKPQFSSLFPTASNFYFVNCSDDFIAHSMMYDHFETVKSIAIQPHPNHKTKCRAMSAQLRNDLSHMCQHCKIYSGYFLDTTKADIPRELYYSSYRDFQARWALETIRENEIYKTGTLTRLLGKHNLSEFFYRYATTYPFAHRAYPPILGSHVREFLLDTTNRTIAFDR